MEHFWHYLMRCILTLSCDEVFFDTISCDEVLLTLSHVVSILRLFHTIRISQIIIVFSFKRRHYLALVWISTLCLTLNI